MIDRFADIGVIHRQIILSRYSIMCFTYSRISLLPPLPVATPPLRNIKYAIDRVISFLIYCHPTNRLVGPHSSRFFLLTMEDNVSHVCVISWCSITSATFCTSQSAQASMNTLNNHECVILY